MASTDEPLRAGTPTRDVPPTLPSSHEPPEIVMTKKQVFMVLLTILASVFLVALDRTILATVSCSLAFFAFLATRLFHSVC